MASLLTRWQAHCLRNDPVKSLYLINFNNTFVPSTCTAALDMRTIQSCAPEGVPYDRLLTGVCGSSGEREKFNLSAFS